MQDLDDSTGDAGGATSGGGGHDSAPFTVEEREAVRRQLREAPPPVLFCPRCCTPLQRTAIPPRRDTGYVRDRILLVCPGCGGRLVVDRPRSGASQRWKEGGRG